MRHSESLTQAVLPVPPQASAGLGWAKPPTEAEWLLLGLGTGPHETRAGKLAQLSDSEWDQVVRQAARHGVTHMLYQSLKTTSPGVLVPDRAMQRLHDGALQIALRNLLLYQELSYVLTELRNAGINIIVLKGAYLAEVIYGNRALRPMHDVDLLVRKTDLARAEAELSEMGYGPNTPPSIAIDYTTHHHLPPFIKSGGVPIEIHWTIEHPKSALDIDIDGLWARARQAALAGVEALVLSPEDLLLHLCIHASCSHKFLFGLLPLCDIAATTWYYRDNIEWPQVQQRARQWGAEKYIYLTLRLAKELVGAPVPKAVLDSLEPEGFEAQVIEWAMTQIFADETAVPIISANLSQLWGERRLRQKAKLLLKSGFPNPAAMARMYRVSPDSSRLYLYYPMRWKELLLQYGRTVWQLIQRDETMEALADRENQKTALRHWLKSVQ